MTTRKRRPAASILAATFGWDSGEMAAYRYQYGRTGKLAIYTVDDSYWTVSKTKPDWSGLDWQKHTDQHFAEQSGTTVWRAHMNSGEAA